MGTVCLGDSIPAVEPDIVIASVIIVIQQEAKSELSNICQVDVWKRSAVKQRPIPPADRVVLNRAHHIHICGRLKICVLQ